MTSPDPAGTYAPGDVVTVWVTFNRNVSVVGDPVFSLNTGKGEPGRAVYVAGSGDQARENAHQGCWLDGGGFAREVTAKDKAGACCGRGRMSPDYLLHSSPCAWT